MTSQDPVLLKRDGYFISDDPALIDFEVVHTFLTKSYWSPGISSEHVQLAADKSIVFGIYHCIDAASPPAQVGYARVLTDHVALAYIFDLFILPEHRGRGLAAWLTETMLTYPPLSKVGGWMLATRDAHQLYEKYGFKEVQPGKYMRRGVRA
jgi:GNAT superfamily N-acetyltransferase